MNKEVKQPLDRMAEFFWTQDVITGITWDDCMALALRFYDAGYRPISPKKLTVLSEKDLEWLDEARSYAAKKFGIDDGYLDLFSYRNIDAWRDYIDDGYTPKDAVGEDLSYAD
jgi:hypothetical protein